ncbi:NAD(P)H-dependent oxidoreductase [Streptomyces sp. 549]|uniref:NAD(P)H-dependent oxidoreductase n=1 Tax=Streptomyces sp. 549 TaxID=3049076 RepID=UPI0024C31560|nr:NAD(P)H-dependent oxidoreductase [Streptomyces sp. 549]MDK1472577.1 NAD(P)H-dependent oxidoreductase [Streptomyces sp. 549]
MNVLWIFAHPEQRSLNASLRDEGLRELAAAGHPTRVSDLYTMGFDPVLDAGDFPADPSGDRLRVGAAQERAHRRAELSADVSAEQEKVRWASVLVFQFPLWWFGPPAILKGWFDRVFAQGFAFGVRDERGHRRYGDGGLAGRRALTVTSVGARASGFGPRGVHGRLDEVLFPLLHGTFWYTGLEALPPYAVYGADRLTDAGYAEAAAGLRERIRALPHTEPLPFRTERGGDYDADLVLYPHVAPGRTDLGAHYTSADDRTAPCAASGGAARNVRR